MDVALSTSVTSPFPLLAAVQLSFNWFDAVFLITIGFGCYDGKKNGLSGEHIPLFKWMLIGLAGGVMGDLFGSLLQMTLSLSSYWSRMIGAALWIGTGWGVFAFLNSKGITQLKDSDWFGKVEYPLGVVAGALRLLCILLTVMSLLNGRIYTTAQIQAQREEQIRELGSAIFPTVGMINGAVFKGSYIGPRLNRWMGWAFITASPAPPKR